MSAPKEMVPMNVAKAFGKWFPGNVAGFPPTQAAVIFQRGLATYVDPEDGPTSFDQPANSAPAPAKEPDPQTELVVVPADWAEMHHTKIMALAKRIAGDAAPSPLTLEVAKTVITEELARRAGTEGA